MSPLHVAILVTCSKTVTSRKSAHLRCLALTDFTPGAAGDAFFYGGEGGSFAPSAWGWVILAAVIVVVLVILGVVAWNGYRRRQQRSKPGSWQAMREDHAISMVPPGQVRSDNPNVV